MPCGYSMSAIWTFDVIDVYRGEGCIKKFGELLKGT